MVAVLGAQTDTGTIIEPQSATFGLLVWDFETLLEPDAHHPGVTHLPTLFEQKSVYPAIAIATVL
jgi:hypothetical protein